MDEKVIQLVRDYILNHLDKSDETPQFDVYTVWKCKTLQNWKYLLASTLPDGMYYELTYNGDKKEWYLDAYKKFENVCKSYQIAGICSTYSMMINELNEFIRNYGSKEDQRPLHHRNGGIRIRLFD